MAALVTGIVGLVPVAVGLGVLGIRRTADGTRAGRGLAVAGLVLAGVWTLLAILALAVLAFLVTGLAVSASCVGERCDVTVRGEQLTELSDHDLAVTDIGAGRATVTVDGDPVQLRVGETRQVGRSMVQLTSVEGEVVELTIDFGGEYLTRDEVESRVAVELGVDRQQVTCPRDLAAAEGTTMTCDVAAGPGTWSEARVTVTAVGAGQVDTTVEGSRAPERSVERAPLVDPPPVGALTAEELSWIQAVDELMTRMNDVFANSPTVIDAPALTALAEGLRGCPEQVAAAGPPGPRLESLLPLIEQGCSEYDKGATCFAEAAALSESVKVGDADRAGQLINCGFASSGAGLTPMLEAWNRAERLRAGVDG